LHSEKRPLPPAGTFPRCAGEGLTRGCRFGHGRFLWERLQSRCSLRDRHCRSFTRCAGEGLVRGRRFGHGRFLWERLQSRCSLRDHHRRSFPRLRGKVAEGRKGSALLSKSAPFRLPAPSPAAQGKDSIGGDACSSFPHFAEERFGRTRCREFGRKCCRESGSCRCNRLPSRCLFLEIAGGVSSLAPQGDVMAAPSPLHARRDSMESGAVAPI